MRLFSLLVIVLTSLMVGCSVNPVTGKTQFSIISPEQEVQIGQKNYIPSQQSQGGRYTVNPDLTVYVRNIGMKMAKVSDRPGLPYDFVVLNNDVPNAWALPGGKIAINRGLLLHLEDESQLAAVLGHEVVHAAARHGATQQTQNILLQAGVQAVGYATQNTQYGDYARTGANLGASAWQARYGREQELEADEHGIEYMVKAGYDPQGAVELQKKFVELSKNRQTNWFEALFASHPPSQERVLANQQHARKSGNGHRNRNAYQKAIYQLKKDKPAYEKHAEAIKAANNKQFSQALSLVAQATKLQPKENLFWETKGHIENRLGKTSSALASYNKAIARNPDYFSPYLAKGILEKKLGKNRQAEDNLIASHKRLPTSMAAYHLGELSLNRNNRDQAIQYFQFAAQDNSELGKAAQQKLNALTQPAKQ